MPDTITITYGEQHFMPHKFQGFRSGPFSITTELRPNESYAEAYDRCWPELKTIADRAYLSARNSYAERFLASKE